MTTRGVFATLLFLLASAAASFAADGAVNCPEQGKLPPPLLSSHILPLYPSKAAELGEHGPTLLSVSIGNNGVPSDIKVSASSGSATLDDTAASIVSSHWRWLPFPTDCNISAIQIAIQFNWFLKSPPKIDFGLTVSGAQYPAGAAERYEWGDTYLAITLDEAGKVTDGKIAYSSGYQDLDEKALAMVRNAPGIFAGKPVGTHIMLAKWNLPAQQAANVERVVILDRRGSR